MCASGMPVSSEGWEELSSVDSDMETREIRQAGISVNVFMLHDLLLVPRPRNVTRQCHHSQKSIQQ